MKSTSKFARVIRKYGGIVEQSNTAQDALAQDAALDPNAAQTAQAAEQPVEPPEKPDVKTLTPEGEVELIRLLRKALTLDVDPNTLPVDIIDVEINQENARDIYTKIRDFMSTYTG